MGIKSSSMNKIIFVMALVLVGCQSSTPPISPASNGLSSNGLIQPNHSDLIHKQLDVFPNRTEVSIALISEGQVQYYGVIRNKDILEPKENKQAVFEIGSISKVFTSTLLASYVLEGKLSLDDYINDYLDFELKDGIQISFQELSNHSSGLPRMPSNFMLGALLNPSNPYKKYSEKKLKTYLTKKLALKYEKGKKSNYSNLGAGLISYTLSKFSGEDYQTMLQERIFRKFQMNQSTTQRKQVKQELVQGLDKKGKATSNWDLSALEGAGAILSSTTDLTKFAIAHFDSTNQELALTRKLSLSDSTGMDLGLGWHIIKTKSGNRHYWHNGGTGGYRSSMALDIEKETAVIILSNVSAFHDDSGNIDQLCFSLLESLEATNPKEESTN